MTDAAAWRKLWEETGHDLSLGSCDASVRPAFAFRGIGAETPLEAATRPGTLLARGGCGEVWRTSEPELEREVAIKRVRRDLPGKPGLQRRFLAEAVATGQLEHPQIVPVYGLDVVSGEPRLRLRLIAGESWEQRLRTRPRTLEAELEVLLQVCDAVAFAHSRGIVHGDLKPSNVMRGDFGETLVVDWGLALRFDDPERPSRVAHARDQRHPCGTPSYMAPEQRDGRGERFGPATDVYLLGGILYRLLCGKPPHAAATIETALAMADQLPVLPPDLPAELAAICARALTPAIEERFPDVPSFQDEVRRYIAHRPSRELTAVAERELGQAVEGSERYPPCARAIAGFEQALKLWPENRRARDGLARARRAYATAALDGGDLGLASTQLEQLTEEARAEAPSRALATRIEAAGAAVRRRRRQLKRARIALAATALALIGGLWIGMLLSLRAQDQLATRNARIRLQARHLREAQAVSRLRAEVAVDALRRLQDQVQERLLHGVGYAPAQEVARELLRVADSGWTRLRSASVDDPELRLDAVETRVRSAQLRVSVDGDHTAAIRELDSAAVELTQRLGARSGSSAERLALVRVLEHRARSLLSERELEAARDDLERARGLLRAAGLEEDPRLLRLGVVLAEVEVHSGQLQAGYERILKLLPRLDSDPLRFERRSALFLAAQVARRLGDADASQDFAAARVEALRAALAREPGHFAHETALVEAWLLLSETCLDTWELERADAALAAAAELNAAHRALAPQRWTTRLLALRAREQEGHLASVRSRAEDAREAYRAALDLARALEASAEGNTLRGHVLRLEVQLAEAELQCFAVEGAELRAQRALSALWEETAAHPDDGELAKACARAALIAGDAALFRGQTDAARTVWEDGLARIESLLAEDPAVLWSKRLALTLRLRLAELAGRRGEGPIEALLGPVVGELLELTAAHPENLELQHDSLVKLGRYGDVMQELGALEDARRVRDAHLAAAEALAERFPSPMSAQLRWTALADWVLLDGERTGGADGARLAQALAGLERWEGRLSPPLWTFYTYALHRLAGHRGLRKNPRADVRSLRRKQLEAARELHALGGVDVAVVVEALLDLAVAQRAAGALADALESLDRAAALAPRAGWVLYERAQLTLLRGETDRCLDDLRAAAEVLPEASAEVAAWRVALGEPRALLDPYVGDPVFAPIARFLQEPTVAADEVVSAIRQGPDPSPTLCLYFMLRGLLSERAGDAATALLSYQAALRHGETWLNAWRWADERTRALDAER